MDITTYCEKTKYKDVYMSVAVIGKNYRILTADRSFYEFIGSCKEIPVTYVIHPEDLNSFYQAMEQVETEPQHLIIRMQNIGHIYRYFKVRLDKNDRIVDGAATYNMTIMDIYSVESRFAELEFNVSKYRRYMALMNEFYFEYDIDSREFKIFVYLNDRSSFIVREDFGEFCKDILENHLPDEKARMQFEAFRSYVEDGVDSFCVQFATTYLSQAARVDVVSFNGSTFYRNDRKEIVMGTMKCIRRGQKEETYYLTDAAKDCATGLFNKRAIMEYVTERIQISGSDKMAVIIMDIDDFKEINDTFGHLFGDEVIAKVSDVINSVVNSKGVVGRFGGDEFMIILENYRSKEALETLLGTIAQHLKWLYRGIKDELNLTASIGVARFPDDGRKYEELFEKADKALYIVKQRGKNGYAIYDDQIHGTMNVMKDVAMRRRRLTSDWADVISESILELHRFGQAAIPGVMRHVCEATEISGINVYFGENLARTYTEGTFNKFMENATEYVNEEYLKEFDENGVFILKNVDEIFVKYPQLYKTCDEDDVRAFMQCVTYSGNTPTVLISYDVVSHTYNWEATEANLLILLAKMIGQVLVEK